MFDSISVFVNDISSFNVPIPLNLQIALIITIIIALCIGGYFLRDVFDITSMRSGMSWFIFIAVLNLSTLLIIFIYYNNKNGKYKGPIGNTGKKGLLGKKGTSISCNFCKNNIYLQKVRKSDVICRLDIFSKDFVGIFDKEKYFNDILNKGNNIDYDSFVNNIILHKTSDSTSGITPAIINFSALMDSNSIAVLLIKAINDITKASSKTYGTFRQPDSVLGEYIPLGDTVYGGLEDKMVLNSFVVDGNILYPSNYIKLVSFKSYNKKNGDIDIYTIWRANGQTINETGFKNSRNKVHYSALGDICRYGKTQPKVNELPTISENCLEEIDSSLLQLVFVYVGNIEIKNEVKDIDYSQSDTYLIENTPLNKIEIFSVWRTPMNTFLTNCNSQNEIVNQTLIYNIINNLNSSLNKYGNIKAEAKAKIGVLLEQIQIPKIIVSLILCKYYEIELIQEVVYYINRYRNAVPEFKSVNTSTSTFGDLMDIILQTKTSYQKYNDDLLRKANIKLNGKIINYDEKNEKHLPKMILEIYDTTQTKLLTIPIRIENTTTLLDIINLIFENGFETKIAVDSDGIAQGGIFLNSIQEMVLRICKVLMPPNIPVYTIKDECLGTFALDREREDIIKLFTESKNIYDKLMNTITDNYDKYQPVMPNIYQYQNLTDSKIGQLCGHINNYNDKINSGNLEEITTSRIKGLTELYNDMNSYLQNVNTKV